MSSYAQSIFIYAEFPCLLGHPVGFVPLFYIILPFTFQIVIFASYSINTSFRGFLYLHLLIFKNLNGRIFLSGLFFILTP